MINSKSIILYKLNKDVTYGWWQIQKRPICLTDNQTCYRKSLNPSVASVIPINSKNSAFNQVEGACTDSAVVVVESRDPNRKTTLIIAENESTGNSLQVSVLLLLQKCVVVASKVCLLSA